MNDKALLRFLLVVSVVLVLAKLATATLLPLTQDEAYYLWWSLKPKLGYLDHPPMISYLLAFAGKTPSFPLYARWPSLVLTLLSFPLFWSLLGMLKLKKRSAKVTAFVLCQANFLGVLSGVIPTPDAPLMFFWLLALHEGLAALTLKKQRWLTAGIATGLGLLSKYTMLLMGPVYLWALIKEKRQLRTPWPYLGGFMCVLVLVPHLFWLSQHDWASVKFQVQHGFVGDHSAAPTESYAAFPPPAPTVAESFEQKAGDYFNLDYGKIEKPHVEKTALEALWQRVGDYAGSQLAWWGFFLPLVLVSAWRQRKVTAWRQSQVEMVEPGRALMQAAAWFPLGLFAIVTLFTGGEANWPVMYVMGAAVVVAAWRPLHPKSLLVVVGIHAMVLVFLGVHVLKPNWVKKPHKDRLLVESYGYPQLADYLSNKTDWLMTDTYQNAAQLSLWLPSDLIVPWPELTRRSEFNYRADLYDAAKEKIEATRTFYLLTMERTPPTLPGYNVRSYEEIRDCTNGKLGIVEFDLRKPYVEACESYVHRWFLGRYERPIAMN